MTGSIQWHVTVPAVGGCTAELGDAFYIGMGVDEADVCAGKGGRVLWWPGRRVGPLRLSEARCLDLSGSLASAADLSGRPLAFLGGQAPCVRALTVGGGVGGSGATLGLLTRGGELWQPVG